ncbi:MAG: alpha-amylase family glycosyl hydrolase [Ferruginibacter sp.]
MKRIKNIFLVLIICTIYSCNKNDNNTSTPSTPVIPVTPVSPVDVIPTQYGIPFSNVPDREDVTMYEVNIRAFSAQGNLQGVISRLDSIRALGVNVIYLMPVYPVGVLNAVNSPYCVKDYTAVNTEFGTLADLRTLVEAAHTKGMAVIMDWVANHTSWDHAWITSHKDWYLQDGAGNIVHPPNTNYTDVAQLNFSNQAMRVEMAKTMRNWIYKANVDGFRCDCADGPTQDFWKQVVDTLRNISSHELLLMAESNQVSNYVTGFDFIFGFNFYGQIKSIYNSSQSVLTIDALNNSEYLNASDGQQVVRFTSNHDVNGSDGTPEELFGGNRGSMAAFIIAAYMKSVPMVYNGQEVGTPFRLTFPFTSANINWTINPDVTAEYKRILLFRNGSNAVRRGILTSFSTADICAFTKELAGEKVLVISNLRNNANNYMLASSLSNTSWTDAMNGGVVALTTQVSLQPYEYLVLRQ